ncbi:MAG: hypothetical protein AAB267_03950, partial [Candidatus Desantisbacteria bacterium]
GYAYIREIKKGGPYFSPLLFGLSSLTRPEGVLLFAGTILHQIILFSASKRRIKDILIWALFFLLIFLSYYLWRYNYYGYPLPNTFYAKVGSGWPQYLRGLQYAQRFVSARYFIVFLPFILLLTKRRKEEWFSYSLLIVSLYTLYIIGVGGDWPIGYRFFVPILPFIYLMAQEGLKEGYRYCFQKKSFEKKKGMQRKEKIARLEDKHPFALYSLTLILATGIFIGTIKKGEYSLCIIPFRELDKARIATGKWLKMYAPKDSVIAVGGAGSTPYYSELKTIDMFGMNDLHIAHLKSEMGKGAAGHEKSDMAYVYSRRPDFIIGVGQDSGEGDAYYKVLREGVPEEVARYMTIYKRRF